MMGAWKSHPMNDVGNMEMPDPTQQLVHQEGYSVVVKIIASDGFQSGIH
jgi:hypothetical protein